MCYILYVFDYEMIQDSERIKIVDSEGECVLCMDRAMSLDEGEYSCKLINQAGEATCGAVLFVQKDM